ncbi:segregation/condensation protein A [Streptococcus halichoeri]|uniref:segregation/condensation protein A n=1 Tax=Streptococcus halichoeri TaxID=254785 RepID=UPI0013586701|nr:segregation/condensation protein A [Streptococcus halichoeri]
MDIKLKDFEGPLDLLLHLVAKYQVDIYDVPIVEVIEQYLAYIETLQIMRLEVAGDYMVMASQLMVIKSRKLLPKVVEPQEVEADPEMSLLNQLEEYSKFKELSEGLALKHDQRAKFFSKPKQELIFEDTVLQEDKTVMDLFLVFSKLMTVKQATFKQNHTVIERDHYRIEDKMQELQVQLEQRERLTLEEVFAACQSRNEMITLFLATLELIKIQFATVSQATNFGTIVLQREASCHT